MNRHRRILSFAVSTLLQSRARNLSVVCVYAALVGLVASLLLFVGALRSEARQLLREAPELTVQRLTGGRHDLIPVDRVEGIRRLRGVSEAQPRLWGYVFDPPTESTFTLWGAESVPRSSLVFAEGGFSGAAAGECIVGQGVAETRFLGIGDRLPLKGSDGQLFAPRVVGIFTTSSAVLTNDLVVIPEPLIRGIFAMDDGSATDIAVRVYNPNEVATVARKIQEMWPDVRTISRQQILRTYDAVFDWRGGIWGALLLGSIAAFAVLVWDKASGLSAEEHRVVGILKAVGWSSREVLELKVWEATILSLVSCLAGLIAAQVHLFWLDGALFSRLLRGWSVIFPDLDLALRLDFFALSLCLTLAVVPYVVASLLPIWRLAITEPDSIIRS